MDLSIQKWMIKSVFIPNTVPIEHKQFASCGISEHEVLIEDVAHPHEFIFDGIGINLFQILDVDYELVVSSKEPTLLEDNLLSVRQQFCMPAEVGLLSPSSRHIGALNKHGQESDFGASAPGQESESNSPIRHA